MFSWYETVGLSMISILKDPQLVLYFLSILRPMRRDFLEEEAREWHSSLRLKQEDRWAKLKELSMKRKFNQMNMSVPVSCTLPFDGGMWRNSQNMLKMIRYFRGDFIKKRIYTQIEGDWDSEVWADIRANIREKVKIVNKAFHKDQLCAEGYLSSFSRLDMEEALNDYTTFTEDPEDETPYNLLPYLCEIDYGGGDIGTMLEIVN